MPAQAKKEFADDENCKLSSHVSSNRCHASSNRCLTSSNKKLVETNAYMFSKSGCTGPHLMAAARAACS